MYANVWEEDYKKLLENKPKNAWVPARQGSLGDKEVEISCVHTSFPHGLLSWGWNGDKKLPVYDSTDFEIELPKKKRIVLQTKMQALAEQMCVFLNANFPKGL